MLRLLNTGGIHALDRIAAELGISEALAGEMADGLTRRGYLAALSQECGSGCDGCAVAGMCAAPGQATSRVLMLTEKGRRAAAG